MEGTPRVRAALTVEAAARLCRGQRLKKSLEFPDTAGLPKIPASLVTLTGQFLCSREAVREFKRRGVRPEISCAAGKINCVSSVHEVIPWAGHVNYAASKGGVMLIMKSIAQEVAPYRIRVNSIAPGAIRTPINMQAWDAP
jgi:NAD(P)-dependent dehydrogenase (short-subunit alcohol dehydrogenase family)